MHYPNAGGWLDYVPSGEAQGRGNVENYAKRIIRVARGENQGPVVEFVEPSEWQEDHFDDCTCSYQRLSTPYILYIYYVVFYCMMHIIYDEKSFIFY